MLFNPSHTQAFFLLLLLLLLSGISFQPFRFVFIFIFETLVLLLLLNMHNLPPQTRNKHLSHNEHFSLVFLNMKTH
jgi:hypothetical protein